MSRLLQVLCLLCVAIVPGSGSAKTTDGTWQPAGGDVIRFEVMRQGKPFGYHQVSFETAPEGRLIARTDVDLRAGLGPVTFFRYRLEATEVWENGELVSLTGKVRDDGNMGKVFAERTGDRLSVDGTMFKGTLSAGILPASHWNARQMSASRLLSTEDGEILDVAASEIGREKVTIAGRQVDATRYRMDAAIDVDLWYDDAGRWVKLAFTARGQEIEYVLAQPY